jgi:IMP and pyridine-specific 5'-nucleotidase
MKSMLQHSFVLDALETTASDTFTHFEMLIDEHRELEAAYVTATGNTGILSGTGIRPNGTRHSRSHSSAVAGAFLQPSRLRQLVPTIGSFHTPLPLREAFEIYNEKHQLTKRKHIQISFNEIRHILNLAQIIALHRTKVSGSSASSVDVHDTMARLTLIGSHTQLDAGDISTCNKGQNSSEQVEHEEECKQFRGPRLVTFDGDQTLYSDGANFDSNPHLANYLYLLLKNGASVAIVTAAGYEYNSEKYEYRLSGLLSYFAQRGLSEAECESFYLFGGECNYLLQLRSDYKLHAIRESGPCGWMTATQFLPESPANWPEQKIQNLLDVSEKTVQNVLDELRLRGRVIRKKRSIGLAPNPGREITRESLDEAVLRCHEELHKLNCGTGPGLPYCAFNGGTDMWVDVGNKRVGVQILQAYLGIPSAESLHIGDQFLNTGNDYAARDVSPCVWIINPQETTYVLKSLLRLAGVDITLPEALSVGGSESDDNDDASVSAAKIGRTPSTIDFTEIERRRQTVLRMDVYTGELVKKE